MANVKKNSTAKSKGSSPPSLHPPYFQMICEAISAMKDRTGSSQPAIAKFIEENYPKTLPPNFKKILSVQLKRFVKSDKLVKVKNSYKISSTLERKPATARNAAARKTVEKAKKTKRLSQVKTPEGLKAKVVAKRGSAGGGTMKRTMAVTPAKKRKLGPKSVKTAPKKAKN